MQDRQRGDRFTATRASSTAAQPSNHVSAAFLLQYKLQTACPAALTDGMSTGQKLCGAGQLAGVLKSAATPPVGQWLCM
jgi:hypothetical protein